MLTSMLLTLGHQPVSRSSRDAYPTREKACEAGREACAGVGAAWAGQDSQAVLCGGSPATFGPSGMFGSPVNGRDGQNLGTNPAPILFLRP